MEICVLNPYFYPYNGGTEKVLLEVYRRIAKKHNITVITSSVRSQKANEEIFGIKIIRLKPKEHKLPHLPLPLLSMEGLNPEIEKLGADIYHINNRYQYFWGTLKAIKKSRGRLAITIHNSLPKGIDPITDFGGLAYDVFWGRKIMKSSEAITAVSKNAMEVTVPKSMQGKAHVIPNGIDYALFKPGLDKEKTEAVKNSFGFGEGITVINNGRLTVQKGQEYLIKAVAELNMEGTKCNLVIIGRGPLEKRLWKLATALGIKERVRIISDIGEASLPYYYSASDIFVFPSLYEPAGVAMLEAVSAGLPTIATRIGGIPETLKEYGEYIKVKDSKSISAAIAKVSADIGHYRNLSIKCRENVIIKEHDWDAIAEKYNEVFESIQRA
ncbi:glycosyltransferase family 4 protein [Candidatus Marsarchaeota archaeon]|nr:glycosyltransferase family 4 protein [Candidatus Marsarchaeota archaeon]